jgi:divalent metal cation (Fe/Co/Zn/Cd) transporter
LKTQKLMGRLAIRGLPQRQDDAYLRMIGWTRFAFAVSAVQVAVATMFAFSPTLWLMAPVAALAAIMGNHFYEYVYNYGIRRWTRTEPLPANAAPTKFAFGMMSAMLVATATAFDYGVAWLGYGLGGMIIAVSALVCVTHFCLPAAIYKFVMGERAQIRCALGGQ